MTGCITPHLRHDVEEMFEWVDNKMREEDRAKTRSFIERGYPVADEKTVEEIISAGFLSKLRSVDTSIEPHVYYFEMCDELNHMLMDKQQEFIPQCEYSISASGPWHGKMLADDIWMHDKLCDGTWSEPFRFKQ